MKHGEKQRGERVQTPSTRKAFDLLAPAAWALGVLVSAGCGAGSSDSVQPTLALFPDEAFVIAGPEGGPYFPQNKPYLLSNAGEEPLEWSARTSHPSISILPSSGTLDAGESVIATTSVSVVNGLPPGQYEARLIFVNESTGTEQEQDALLLISGSGTLLVSPTIGFSSSGPVGGPFAPLSQGYVLTNDSSETIDWAIQSSQPWLSADIRSGQLASAASQGVELAIDPVEAAQLGAATHVANVLFRDLTNEVDFAIVVELVVIEPAAMAVSPSTGFSTAGPPSGPFAPADKSYTLTNLGSELLTWQVSRSANWVTLSRTSGNLAPGQQTSVTIGIDSDVTGSLGDGSHTATVGFTNTANGIGNTSRTIDLTLNSPPAVLAVAPGQPFTSAGTAGGPFQPASKAYTLTNGGGVTLNWQATASAAWLALAPGSGSLAPGASAQVVASIQQGVAAGLAVGQYSAQLAFVNLTNGNGSTSLGASLNVSASGGGSVPVLTPGAGFTGPTQEPGQIGTGTAKAIARWDVVPYQTITEEDSPIFQIGVVAFHIAGIERVSFSLDGGPFSDTTAMTLNPQTGVWEYCAIVDASLFSSDKPIEIRAIAYPKAIAPQTEGTGGYPGGGYPRLLNPLRLFVDTDAPHRPVVYCSATTGSDSSGDGSPGNPYASPWKAAVALHQRHGSAQGGTVYMGAGNYNWTKTTGDAKPHTADSWLTFEAWPGTARDQVKISEHTYPGMDIQRVRLRGISLTTSNIDGDGDDSVWFDGSECVGPGAGVWWPGAAWTYGFAEKYFTGTTIRDALPAFPTGVDLARDCFATRVTYGPGYAKLAVNCTWVDISDFGSVYHPDFISWNGGGPSQVYENGIYYGVRGTNVCATGVFFKEGGTLKDQALVNVVLDATCGIGSDFGEAGCIKVDHFLMINVTHHDAGFRFHMPKGNYVNMSFRGTVFRNMSSHTNAPDPLWFDNCHFLSSVLTPGTNSTLGTPGWSTDFTPQPGSVLKRRLGDLLVPVDVNGTLRVAPTSVGAIE